MRKPWTHLAKSETNFIKGVGLLLIIFHNFLRLLPPRTGENEFEYSLERTMGLLALVRSAPLEIVNLSLSFWGHYGVLIFITTSAYGLFSSGMKGLSWAAFTKNRVMKLYPAFAIAISLYLLLLIARDRGLPSSDVVWSLAFKLTLLHTLIPGQAMAVCGPWWYLSLTVQFYALFPLLFRGRSLRCYGALLFAMSGAATLVTMVANDYLEPLGLNLYHMALGWLPAFCLGLFLASREQLEFPKWMPWAALGAFVAGQFNAQAWALSQAPNAFLLLLMARGLGKRLEGCRAHSAISYIGANSLHIFLVHGFLRQPFVAAAGRLDNFVVNLAIGLAFLAFSVAFAYVTSALEVRLRSLPKLWAGPGRGEYPAPRL